MVNWHLIQIGVPRRVAPTRSRFNVSDLFKLRCGWTLIKLASAPVHGITGRAATSFGSWIKMMMTKLKRQSHSKSVNLIPGNHPNCNWFLFRRYESAALLERILRWSSSISSLELELHCRPSRRYGYHRSQS